MSADNKKRILIVDDEKKVAFFLQESLEDLGDNYEVVSAETAEAALQQIESQPFDLIITDLRMPGINGLELMQRVRAISPETRTILITAYGSDEVEAEARRLQAYSYFTKPFHIEDFIETVQEALKDMIVSEKSLLILSDERFNAITRRLSNLRFETGAQCILLADDVGQLIAKVGLTEGLDITTLVSLLAGGFATTFEIFRHLGEREALNLNFHESAAYDIYSANVGNRLFLTLIFDRRVQTSRIGMVWLYTKRAIRELLEITTTSEMMKANQVFDSEFSASLSDTLDSLFS
ncbi:MAG: response regulator [Anaerolineales bacterium]|nr:MAG: response regulator [Anaerolineales bacterium]